MCEECDYFENHPVDLIRRYPKNKVTPFTTPSEYLEGWDIARGLYDLIDKTPVRRNEDNWRDPVVGYYTAYRGARHREYSQPMFTFKSTQEDCYSCERANEASHHFPRKYAHNGCTCANIAYAGRDCPDHPLPSVDSRWVRLHMGRDSFCNHCEKELPQETWEEGIRWYCNQECKTAYDIAYKKRQEAWEKERMRGRG